MPLSILQVGQAVLHGLLTGEEAGADAIGSGAEQEVEAGRLEAALGNLDGGGGDDAETLRLTQVLAGQDARGQVQTLRPDGGSGARGAPRSSGLLTLHVAGWAGDTRYLRHGGRV